LVKRRVLFCTNFLGGGGAELHVVRVFNALDRARFSPVLVALRAGGPYRDRLSPGADYYELCAPRRARWARRLVTPLAAQLALQRVLAKERPDLVLSVLDAAHAQVWAARRVLGAQFAHVVSIQAPPVAALALAPAALAPLARHIYSHASRVVALSRGVERAVHDFAPATRQRTRVIYNACVDDRVRAAASRGSVVPPPGRRLLVACGRLTEQKGFEYLIEAVALARKVLPTVLLWIVGEGPLEAELRVQIERLQLQDHVALLGFQSDPAAYMRAAELFVLSSVFEGLGMVIVEALACGTPVVATDCPHGPAEILAGERGGILVPPRDPERLANALVELLTNSEHRRRLAEAAQVRAEAFAAETIATQYAALFDEVVR
jgi:glycosyltransferase involved in cell wall biosynthesis